MKNASQQTALEGTPDKCDSTLSQPVQAKQYYPSTETVLGRVLGALLRGERLTHLDCWRRFGSSRLSHHAYSLKGKRDGGGWPINTIEVDVVTTDAARHAMIGLYSLPAEAIAEAGERGRKYAEECAKVELKRRVIGRGK